MKRKDGLVIECTRKDGKERLCNAYQPDEFTRGGFCMDAAGPCGSLYEKRAAREAARQVAKNEAEAARIAEQAVANEADYMKSLQLNAKWEI